MIRPWLNVEILDTRCVGSQDEVQVIYTNIAARNLAVVPRYPATPTRASNLG